MDVLKLYRRMADKPGGKLLFSQAVARKAPFFITIAPRIIELDQTRSVVRIPKRRAITNHIGTVHAIAMCNLAEFAGGLLTEVACPPSARWIPKGMTVEYLAKAETDLIGTSVFPQDVDWAVAQEVPVPVEVRDLNDVLVFRAEIRMYCSPKPLRQAA